MGKYFVRYLIFWLPAFLFATLFQSSETLFVILQWLFAFFMVFSWALNTGMAAYQYPRSTLAAVLVYTGFNLIVLVVMYGTRAGSGLHTVLRAVGGIFSFKALDIMVQTIKPFNVPHEMVITLFLIGCCVVGFLAGLIHRHVRPNPYRPRMRKS